MGKGFFAPVKRDNANVAQLVEHFLGKEEVGSSILLVGSSFAGMFCFERSQENDQNGERAI